MQSARTAAYECGSLGSSVSSGSAGPGRWRYAPRHVDALLPRQDHTRVCRGGSARPELARGLFFADDSPQRSDFKKTDIIDGNWLHLGQLASTFAQPGSQPVDFVAQETWLSKAVNGSGADALDIDFGYGPVWELTPHRVAEIAKGLKTEAAALPTDPSELDDSDDSVLFYAAEVAAIARFLVLRHVRAERLSVLCPESGLSPSALISAKPGVLRARSQRPR